MMETIVVAGASGLIGMALVAHLKREHYRVIRLVRPPSKDSQDRILWDPEQGVLDGKELEGVAGVINLAGENIAALRWTRAKKERIRQSRLQSTRLLASTLAKLSNPPKFLLNASAIGYYGDRGSECLHERSSKGKGFLPDLCDEWEKATQPATDAGIRVASLRFGMVLSRAGGALSRILLPFRFYLGGVIGSGEQWISWIAIDDAIKAIEFLMKNEEISGPVNLVAPDSVTNREFTECLGKTLHRPTCLPLPSFVAKIAFGEMGEALMLSSCAVKPAVLQKHGFKFNYPTIDSAFNYLLN